MKPDLSQHPEIAAYVRSLEGTVSNLDRILRKAVEIITLQNDLTTSLTKETTCVVEEAKAEFRRGQKELVDSIGRATSEMDRLVGELEGGE